jgi:ubiquinone/menaquinone biosynthesis C-methylase UbiE
MVAPRAGHTGLVRGVDVSPRMLELARHKAQSFGFDQCEFVLGDYAQLDTPDATFDLLICSFALWGDPQSVLAEFLRLLKPGGVLLLQNWAPERDGAARTFQETLNAFSVADSHAPLAALREHLAQRAAAWGELSDPDRFTATLRAAGFATAGGQWFSNPLHFATFAELAEFYTTGVRAWAEYRSFTPERRDQFLDALHNAFRPLKTARGLDTEARAIQVVARKPNN